MRKLLIFFVVFLAGCPQDEEEPTRTPELPEGLPVHVAQIDGETWEDPAPQAEELPEEPQLPVYSAAPPGFPEEDQYDSHASACLGVVMDLAPKKYRIPILKWCNHRSWAASRNAIVVSRVDGSQIHDRDRPTAYIFYERQVARGVFDPYDAEKNPTGCPYHAVNRKLKHTRNCKHLQKKWPFKDTRLSDKLRNNWRTHPHDMERFGARGPHDWNAHAYNHIPGCWDPAQLERFDVSITVTVTYAIKLCEKYGCTFTNIKKHWPTG